VKEFKEDFNNETIGTVEKQPLVEISQIVTTPFTTTCDL